VADYNYVKKITAELGEVTGIAIHELSWREQLWMATTAFDLGIKNNFDQLIIFAKRYGKNGLKTFLSTEFDLNMGEKILSIGENLSSQPVLADKLFAEYARLVDSAAEEAKKISQVYNELFFDKTVDQDKVRNMILKKANSLLEKSAADLSVCPAERKEEYISGLLADLKRQEMINKMEIAHFAEMMKSLNSIYRKIEFEIQGYNYFIDPDDADEQAEIFAQQMFGASENWGKNKDRIAANRSRNTRYDSPRLKGLIDRIKNEYRISSSEKLNSDQVLQKIERDLVMAQAKYEKWKDVMFKNEKDPEFIAYRKDVEELNRLEDMKWRLQNGQAHAQGRSDFYQAQVARVKKLEELLGLQIELEKKLDQFASGEETPASNQPIFQKYQELVDQTKMTKDRIRSLFKNDKQINNEELDKVAENILQKANDLLSSYTRKITAGQEINEQELLAELAGYEAELVSMGAVLATLKKQFQQDLRPEDIQGVEFKEKVSAAQLTLQGRIWPALEQLVVFRDGRPMIPGTALSGALAAETGLSEEERQASNRVRQMLDIYARNYAHNPALRDELIAGLWEKLKTGQESTRFYLYEKNGQVIAFNRFDDEGAGRKHFGSCNVAAGAKDSTIGDALYRQSIREEGPGFLVEAIVKPFSPAMHLYVDKDQFVAEEIEDDKAISFVIRRYGDQKNAPSFALKGLSPEQIKNIYQQQDNHPDAYLGKDSFVWQGNNEEEAIAWAKKALAAGQEPRYRITRYFLDKDKKLYVGFEKI